VVNEELDPNYSTRLLSSLVSSERHIIQAVNYSSLSEAIESVKTTRSVAALRIPKYFSEAIDTRITEGFNADNQTIIESTISVYIDNSVIMYSRGVINSLTESLISFLSDIYSENGKTFKGIAISFEKTENSKNLMINNYYLPAFYLYYLYMSQITLSSLLLTQERKDGLFERSLIAGVSHEVVFISHLITNCLLALIQILLLYVMGFMLFNVINNSSLPLLFSYLFLECLNAISFGLLISSLVDREIVSVIIVWFVTLPQLFCSGLFYPLEAMNPLLKTVFYYLSSLSIPIETMRNLVLRGWHLNNPSLSFGFLWSIVPSLVCLVIAMVIFKRK
jgi:ABC-type multidrug transport system permease subunit